MTDFTVYPRRMDFGSLPAGSQSQPQWVSLTNHKRVIVKTTEEALDVEDWGVNGHFVSQRPALRQLNPASVTPLRDNTPASGSTIRVLAHGGYVFEGNSVTGIGVFKVDASGVAVELSRYTTIVPSLTGGGFYHDGRFLYVRNTNGLHILKLDKYDNLILLDVIDPNGGGVVCVHGCDGYVYTADSTGVTVLEVNTVGVATVVYSLAVSGAMRVWARCGWLFVLSSTNVFSYKVGLDGRLTSLGFRGSGGGVVYEELTGDDKFVYTMDDSGSDDLISLTVNDKGDFFDADSVTIPTSNHYGLYFDGGYLLSVQRNRVDFYSVDRDTGGLDSVLNLVGATPFYDTWYDGVNLIVARSTNGLATYGFDDSRIQIPVYYTPLGYEQHEGSMQVQGATITLVGDSPSAGSPYVRIETDSVRLKIDARWDKITYEFFRSFDRVEDVKDANPHVPSEIKARAYVPAGTVVHKPTDDIGVESAIGAVEWRQ